MQFLCKGPEVYLASLLTAMKVSSFLSWVHRAVPKIANCDLGSHGGNSPGLFISSSNLYSVTCFSVMV